MHDAQHEISVATVRLLVDEQYPGWRELPIRTVPSYGTVNAIFRIGDGLAARLPLVGDDAEGTRRALVAEAEAARRFAGRTQFPTPEPVAIGAPGAGYPLPWAVQTWLPGEVATPDSVAHSTEFAQDLAAFIRGVRTIDTDGRTFVSVGRSGRGGDLRTHDGWMATCFDESQRLLDVPELRRIWARLRELPRGSSPDVMTHGDLIPGNLLVTGATPDALAGGRLVGVLDAGGIGPADPALDLVCAWHLLEPGPRAVLRSELSADDLTWQRGMAWAFEQAMGAAWYYAKTNPAMSLMGVRTLERILADPLDGAAP